MKRLFISLAIFAALFGFAFYGTVALSHEGERLTSLLTEAIDQAKKGNAEAAKQAAERLEARYIESEKRLSYFVDHRNIGQLGVEISTLPSLAEAEDLSNFLASCNSAKTSIIHLVDSATPHLRNVM